MSAGAVMAQSPDQLAADLLAAATGTLAASRAVVAKGALNIKNDARESVLRTAPRHHGHAYKTIDYDEPAATGYAVAAEIGYDKDKPGGALGNLLEFGGGGDHSPPHLDLQRALEAEEPRFERAMDAIARRLL